MMPIHFSLPTLLRIYVHTIHTHLLVSTFSRVITPSLPLCIQKSTTHPKKKKKKRKRKRKRKECKIGRERRQFLMMETILMGPSPNPRKEISFALSLYIYMYNYVCYCFYSISSHHSNKLSSFNIVPLYELKKKKKKRTNLIRSTCN